MRGFLLAATGPVLWKPDLPNLLATICESNYSAVLAVADSAEERTVLKLKRCDSVRVVRMGDNVTVVRRKIREYRRFKVSVLERFCPFDETIYVDNDISIRDATAVFDKGFGGMPASVAVGVTIAGMCVPPGHELPDVPPDFCERQGGVLFLRCPTSRPLMHEWLTTFDDYPSNDGHDQPALRRVVFNAPHAFHEVPRDIFNCRHPCKKSSSRCLIYHQKVDKVMGRQPELDCLLHGRKS